MKELRSKIYNKLEEHVPEPFEHFESAVARETMLTHASAAIAEMVEEELDKQPALVVARMAKLKAQLAETSAEAT